MADIEFNIAKGMIAYYGGQAGTGNAALILVPMEASGLETDATLKDYDTLAAILASTNTEQTTMGRKTITSVTVTVDDTNDRVDITFADPVWTSATGNAVGALVLCYDSDTTAGTDANIVPISKHDFSVTPNGTDITAVKSGTYVLRAS